MNAQSNFEFALERTRKELDEPEFSRGWVLGYVCAAEMEQWQKEYVRNVVWARAWGISA